MNGGESGFVYKNKLLSDDRRAKILEIVVQKKSVTVKSLLDVFPVSRITLARDLELLESEGFLRRVHGGAIANSHIMVAPQASQAAKLLTEEQKRIGKEAAQRIDNGDSIIIESGSTCLSMVENLRENDNLKIATASPRIAMSLAELVENYNRKFDIIIAGGLLNVYKNFILGPSVVQFFENINADIAFLTVTAIDPEAGVMADDMNESAITKAILDKPGRRKIGLITSGKFNRVSFYKVTDTTVFEEIITDSGIDSRTKEQLIGMGVKVTVV